jgi:RNA polymerase-binding transcription factor
MLGGLDEDALLATSVEDLMEAHRMRVIDLPLACRRGTHNENVRGALVRNLLDDNRRVKWKVYSVRESTAGETATPAAESLSSSDDSQPDSVEILYGTAREQRELDRKQRKKAKKTAERTKAKESAKRTKAKASAKRTKSAKSAKPAKAKKKKKAARKTDANARTNGRSKGNRDDDSDSGSESPPPPPRGKRPSTSESSDVSTDDMEDDDGGAEAYASTLAGRHRGGRGDAAVLRGERKKGKLAWASAIPRTRLAIQQDPRGNAGGVRGIRPFLERTSSQESVRNMAKEEDTGSEVAQEEFDRKLKNYCGKHAFDVRNMGKRQLSRLEDEGSQAAQRKYGGTTGLTDTSLGSIVRGVMRKKTITGVFRDRYLSPNADTNKRRRYLAQANWAKSTEKLSDIQEAYFYTLQDDLKASLREKWNVRPSARARHKHTRGRRRHSHSDTHGERSRSRSKSRERSVESSSQTSE